MNNDEFILTQGLGQQLEFALKRNGWTTADVHAICAGETLGHMRKHMLKPAKPVASLKGVIDRGPLFEPWKTITIGVHTPDELIKALVDEMYPIDKDVQQILRSSEFARKRTEVHLAKLNLANLELMAPLSYLVMCRRIRHRGFGFCTPEIAGELRLLNFDDQDDVLTLMAMPPIDDNVLEQYYNGKAGTLELFAQSVGEVGNYTYPEYICVIP